MYRKTNAFFDTLLFAGCPFTYIIIRDLRKQHLCAYQYFTLERISLYVGKGHFSLAVTSSSSSQYSRSFLISARITSLWNTAHSYSFANFPVFARSRESVSVAAPAALHSEELYGKFFLFVRAKLGAYCFHAFFKRQFFQNFFLIPDDGGQNLTLCDLQHGAGFDIHDFDVAFG